MKSLFFIPALIFCISCAICFAQVGHYASTASSSANYSNASYSSSASSYSANSNSSYNYSSAVAAPVHTESARSNQSVAGPVSNTTSYANNTNTSNYYSNTSVNTSNASNNTPYAVTNNARSEDLRKANPLTAPGYGYNYASKTAHAHSANECYVNDEIAKKNQKRETENLHNKELMRMYRLTEAIPYFSLFCYPFDFYNTCRSNIAENEPIPYVGSSALNVSLNGQIVYGRDTLYGIVTLTTNNVFLEPQAGGTQIFGLRFPYSDRNLKSVTVFNGGDELFLIRLAVVDNKLSRVIYIGKISIFDDLYSFSGQVDESCLRVLYDGKVHSLGAFIVPDMKLKLINTVNKACHIKLAPRDFNSIQSVINYLNRHD